MRHQNEVEPPNGPTALLVRPPWIPGEWSHSWVDRMALANGITAPSQRFSTGVAASLRARMDRGVLRRGEVLQAQNDTVLFCDHVLPANEVRASSSTVEICPACLRESGIVMVAWRLSSYQCCHIHQTPIVSRCTECKRLLGKTAVALGRCACGVNPASMGIDRQESAKPIDWGGQVWSSGTVDPASMDARSIAMCVFKGRLLSTVARSRRGRDWGLSDFHPAEHADRWLESEGLRAAFGHSEVSVFLDSIRHPVHRRAAALLIDKLLLAERMRSTVMSTLPLQDWLLSLAPDGLVDTRKLKSACIPYSARRPGFEPLRTAARRWGVSYERLKARLAPKCLLEQSSYGSGRVFQMIETALVDSFCEANAESLRVGPVPEAGVSSWKMPRTVARQLKLSGWLTAEGPGSSPRGTRRKHAGRLLARLRVHAIPDDRPNQRVIALSNPLVYKRMVSATIGELFEGLTAGTVPLYARGTAPDFDGLELPLDALPNFWRSNLTKYVTKYRDPAQRELF
jgi:TniQ